MTLVVDASVAIKWVLTEPFEREARALAESGENLIAPDWIAGEVASVLWKWDRRGDLRPGEATAFLNEILAGPLDLHASLPEVPRALTLALELGHSVYDCVYLALAEREGADLVTADRKFFDRGKASKHRARFAWIGDYRA
jgi:predicted nucleic acid-binding protein